MKPVLVVLSILLIITCLVLGFYLGNSTAPTATPTVSLLLTSPSPFTNTGSQATVASGSSTATPVLNPNQHNLFFVQADDLSQSKPMLISVWLVGYLTNAPQLSLILIYPANPTADQGNANALNSTFAFDSTDELSSQFIQALDAYGIKSDGIIVSDETGTSRFVDWLGGIPLETGSDKSSGSQVLSTLVLPWKNIDSSRSSQQKIAQGICLELNQLKPDTNILSLLMDLLPKHFYSSLSLDEAVMDWKQVTGQLGDLSCTISLP